MKNVLIVFSDIHLPYSPTVLNLFHEFKKSCKVRIFCPEPEDWYTLERINDSDVVYFKPRPPVKDTPSLPSRVYNKIKNRLFVSTPGKQKMLSKHLTIPKAEVIIDFVKDFDGEIIAVDFFSLWCVQQAGKKAHLVSLEINDNDAYRDACSFAGIKSVLIQSSERYEYLFKTIRPPYFNVQNAPPYIDFLPMYNERDKKDLIFCGSAVPSFGVMSCLDFVKDYPEYRLTLKGALPKETHNSINLFYSDLLDSGRLILDPGYLDHISLTEYVSKFRIGFAFYDFYRFEAVRKFNYFTAPSGKVFQYLNSGIPIIANDLPGFDLIKQKDAGAIVSHLSSMQIRKAIDTIESSYIDKAKNARKAAKDFDFSENAASFINFVLN